VLPSRLSQPLPVEVLPTITPIPPLPMVPGEPGELLIAGLFPAEPIILDLIPDEPSSLTRAWE